MNPYAEHADGLRELQDELDDCPTLTWYRSKTDSAVVKILPGSLMLRSANSAGGLSLDSDFACTCLASDFSGRPTTNQIVVYLGKRLAISDVTIAAGGLQYEIKANDAAQSL